MSATATTTQATPKANKKPAARELTTVFGRHELPERTSILLNNEGLRNIGAALAAIKTCTNLLTHRESEADEGIPTLCNSTAYGLLAAIACCTELIDAQVNDHEPDGVIKPKGADAQKIESKAWLAQYRTHLAKGGAQ